MGKRVLAGLVTGAAFAAVAVIGAPAAQAAPAVPAAGTPVNCANVYIGTAGNQQFLHAQCSPVTAHTWTLVVQCSSGATNSSGPYSGFMDVYLYCPPGTTVTNGWINYT
ncbi:hypothetical protein GCM10009665_32970 [Kitasatospora nipponensis]|uniref:Secreted protein n=1 Tax=Kitasatospora nipponensis TaxID=258049 RepID=A0ABP4H083_9ACTN